MKMNLLYYTNFVQKLDYLHSTLNKPTPSFIADHETKLFQTQLATIARLEEVTGNWVIILSSCIVGRFWVRHRLFFIGYEFAPETESLLCGVAFWEGFECAIASFIGCYQVA